jgi:hypothetical protein
MTYISSLKVKNGIIQVSDSLELETGAISRFDDFKKLLDKKGIDEENEEIKLSPKEVWETFKPERIKNKDGTKKTFKIFEFASMQVAGNVLINDIEVKHFIQQLCDTITPKLPLTHQEIIDVFMKIIKDHFPDRDKEEFDNPAKRECFPSTEFIYSHFEPLTNQKFVHKLAYSETRPLKNFTFSDRYEAREEWLYYHAGMVGLAKNFSPLNMEILKDLSLDRKSVV